MASDNAAFAYFDGLAGGPGPRQERADRSRVTNSKIGTPPTTAAAASRPTTSPWCRRRKCGLRHHQRSTASASPSFPRVALLGFPLPLVGNRRVLLQDGHLVEARCQRPDRRRRRQVLQPGSIRRISPREKLLNHKADAAAFDDVDAAAYVSLASGLHEHAVYQVKDDAAEPFNTLGAGSSPSSGPSPCSTAPSAQIRSCSEPRGAEEGRGRPDGGLGGDESVNLPSRRLQGSQQGRLHADGQSEVPPRGTPPRTSPSGTRSRRDCRGASTGTSKGLPCTPSWQSGN